MRSTLRGTTLWDISELPAIIYAAKSTADPHGSIPTQVADCEAAITRERGREIVGPFQDKAMSAFSGNRGDGLAAAKAAATKAAVGWSPGDEPAAELWVQHSDRLARGDGLKADHLAEVFFALRRSGVRLRSVQDDALLQPATVGMAGETNTGYSQRLKAAVTSGKDRQMERGERLGGPVPDGLRLVVERDAADRVTAREYVRDEDRALIVDEMFAMAEAGHGDGAIAAAMNRRGYRTQGGRAFSRRRVQDTLTNQTYAGRIVRHRGQPGEAVVPATNVEALVTPERFDALLEQRAGRDRSLAGRERARERGRLGGAPTLRYALSRLATCARCGTQMYCKTSPYKRVDGSQARAYVCGRIHEGTGTCDAPPVDAEAVDAALVPHVRHFFDDFASWQTTAVEAAGIERETLAAALAALEARASTLGKAKGPAHERYTAALAAGDDARAEVALEALGTIRSDSTAVEAEIAETRASLGTLATASAPSDAMRAYWHELAESIKGRLSESTALADVNAELRVALERVEIETRDDRSLEVRAVYRRRGTWEPAVRPVLDAAGLIPDDPDYVPDFDQPPTFFPDDVIFYVGARARRGRKPGPKTLSVSGNDTQE